MNFSACVAALVFLYATVFLFWGRTLLERKNSTLRKFQILQKALSDHKVSFRQIKNDIELASFCGLEFSRISLERTVVKKTDLKHQSIGTIISMIGFRDLALRRTMHELRIYSFIILALGSVGILRFYGENNYNFELIKFINWMEMNPSEILAVFETIMMGALSLRLYEEIKSVAELFNQHNPH